MNPHDRSNLWAGILLMVGGLWTLSFLDAAGKTLAMMGFHIVMISWMRYLGHTVVLAVSLGPRMGRRLLATRAPRLQWLRAVLLLANTMLFFSALKRLPLAEATAINFCAPLLVVALSPLLLAERGTAARWVGTLVGFAGMLIVVRPGGNLDPVGVAFGLCNACCAAAVQILNRKLIAYDDPLVTLFFSGLVGAVLCSSAVAWFWPASAPTGLQWLILLTTGVTGSLGHYLVISSARHAPASILSPFTYLQIISATVLGMLLFGQHPDAWTALGITIICMGGMFVALAERRRVRAQ